MPEVSILVPVYNVQSYLRESLESLVCQTLRDIEIICINDGSTDCSLKILEEFAKKDKRIKIINKENSGYGASMNTGLKIAAGEYIGIVEPDDFCKNNMFKELYSKAKKFDADIVKSEYYCYFEKNHLKRKTGKFAKYPKNKPLNIKEAPGLIKIQPSIWSAVYKREFLEKNNINFLETKGASFQDTSFSFKAFCLAGKIILTPRAYLYYRQDNENSSIRSTEKVFAITKEYDEITDFLNKNPEIKAVVNVQKLIKQFEVYMWNLTRIDERYQIPFIESFSDTFKSFFEKDELTKEFYKKYGEETVKNLICNKPAFYFAARKYIEEKNRQDERKRLFSVHINSCGVSVILFGKQIIGVG